MVQRNPLYVDPTMELLTPVVDSLLKAESERLDKVLEKLLIRNHALGGHKNAFMHAGRIFHILPRRLFRSEQIKPVHPSLTEEVELYRTMRDNLEHDRKRLMQAFAVVIPKCRNKQEVRDVLPETLVAQIPVFRGMERQREEGFILAENPTLLNQYCQAIDLALLYQANQLIY